MKENISKAVISRLPRYYRYLSDLIEENVDHISSGDLAKRMHVTASQLSLIHISEPTRPY